MAFKHISEVTQETKKYIDDRRKGLIQSCRTGFKKTDEVMLDGIEWRSVFCIGGRPAVGKTLYSSNLLKGIIANNDMSSIVILDFNWEMSSRQLLIRDLSLDTKQAYGNIISTKGKIVNDDEFEHFSHVLDTYGKLPIYFEEEPKTAKEFASAVKVFRDKNPDKKILVRIDHTVLARQSASEGNRVDMLYNLLNEQAQMKKQSDIIFMNLTQLNKDFEDRQQDGSDQAYPRQSDCFGSDAVAQTSDNLILLNRPAKYNINYYGRRPDGLSVTENDMFGHMVKSRNSAPDLILHYETFFEQMRIREA